VQGAETVQRVDANAKSGSFPNADRANLFGTLFLTFYSKWHDGGDAEACRPTFRGALRIAASKADAEFERNFHTIGHSAHGADCPLQCVKKPELSVDEMDAILGECWKLMDRIGTWDYKGLRVSIQE
jgi:hypothetical protein